MFEIIPAVDLKDGKCVQLQQGEVSAVLVSLDNPIEIAKNWVEKGAKALHIIDLSGAFEGRLYHEDIILKIRSLVDVKMQVGGGIRSIELAEKLLEKNIDRIILGTVAYERPEEVIYLAKKYPERIMVAVDSRKNKVVVRGWKEKTELSPVQFAKTFEGYDILILYTNVDVEGLMRGVEISPVREVVKNINMPVYVAGGISSVEDVKSIKNVGARGVIIGSAIYTGKLDFEKLVKNFEHG
ncbi:MAG: 1-(5-phosphoribosyl)-5-((5-phosphoribosylamino)methylideneamino)imidazole-4-carboxamide isomerase [Archaeoglobus sp.]|nr:MAG: 1-(5-phosphoribosyl)-5-((5-phosphoribosylamino)methylideneamino)imidazole-4-carboxamide isomerase [Archaeoglobus sp.]